MRGLLFRFVLGLAWTQRLYFLFRKALNLVHLIPGKSSQWARLLCLCPLDGLDRHGDWSDHFVGGFTLGQNAILVRA